MASNYQRVGIQAVFLTDSFNRGLQAYLTGIDKASGATEAASGTMSQAGQTAGGSLTPSFLKMGVAAGVASEAVRILTDTFTNITSSIQQVASESLSLAVEWERLGLASQAVGQMFGFTSDEVTQLTSQLEQSGIQADVANRAFIQFTRLGLDTSLLPALARGAQDLNVFSDSGETSSDVLDRLTHGIVTLSPIVLRHAGITVDLESAYRKLADELGISTDQLSTMQKQQAALQQVTERLTGVTGLYEISQKTAAGQMASNVRITNTLKAALGAPFTGALYELTKGWNDVLKTWTAAVQEGGALYPILVNLGAVAELLAEQFMGMVKAGSEGLMNLISNFETGFSDLGTDMFNWGVDIIIQLANGIISGAAAAINAAASVINSILSFWFAPGSPPRVAPNLDQWGKSAMEVYLEGFANADFTILKDVQSALQSVFAVFTEQGKLAKHEAENLWADISKSVISGLGGGDIENTFKKIYAAAGEYGGRVVNLIKQEQALAQATKDVENAEQALEASRKRATALDAKRAKQIAEYNQLVRQGAGGDILKAKLAEINATEDAQAAALEEVAAQEEQVDIAKERQDALKEQVALSKELIKTLTDIAKASAAAAPTKAAAGGAGAGGGGPTGPDFPEPDTEGLQNSFSTAISTAIENAKQRIKEAILGFWQEIMDRITTELGPGIQQLQDAWNGLKEAVQPILSGISNNWRGFLDTLEGWWAEHGENIQFLAGEAWGFLVDTWEGIKTNLGPSWETFWGGVVENAKTLWLGMKEDFGIKLEQIGNLFDVFAAIGRGDWDSFTKEIGEIWDTGLEYLSNQWNTWTGILSNNVGTLKQIGRDLFGGLFEGIQEVAANITKWVTDFVRGIGESIRNATQSNSPSKVFASIGKDWMLGLGGGISDARKYPYQAMANSVAATLAPAAMATQSISTYNYRTANVNLGGVSMSQPMTQSQFEAMLDRALNRSF